MTPVQISMRSISGGGTVSFRLDSLPDVCPICHTSVDPKIVTCDQDAVGDYAQIQIVFQCTKKECKRFFIVEYKMTYDNSGAPFYLIGNILPKTPHVSPVSDIIQAVSPSFVDIFNQSVIAEALNLNQMVGIGLRKALEFLIKDLAVAQNPAIEEDIRKKQLGVCIRDHIDDPNIKECAKRAAWLGNDETHYARKWRDKDITDLKILIKLTVNWVETVLLTKKYLEDMKE